MKPQEKILPIEGAAHAVARAGARLGNILVEDGKLDAEDIDQVLALQQTEGLRFGEAALHLALITSEDLRCAVAKQFGFPYQPPGANGFSDELVVARSPYDPRAEEMRALRTQLLIRWFNAGVRQRMLAIVSAAPEEGRSYVAANLAVAFAQLGERTLLIDADFRAPRQHRIFGVSNRFGLSALLARRADRSAVEPIPALGALSLLPAGPSPPNPQELLLRPALAALLDELRSDFDVILFDTPPAGIYADAQTLAFRAGSAMVLARKDRTRLADAASVMRTLSGTGTTIVGTLFNAS